MSLLFLKIRPGGFLRLVFGVMSDLIRLNPIIGTGVHDTNRLKLLPRDFGVKYVLAEPIDQARGCCVKRLRVGAGIMSYMAVFIGLLRRTVL